MTDVNIEQQIDNLIKTTTQDIKDDDINTAESNIAESNTEESNIENNIEGFNTALHQYLEIEEEIKVLLNAIKLRNQKKKTTRFIFKHISS